MAKRKESGYALLLVFLMAAVIAISLYSEIPRVAFQSQRHKEQLLMGRGLQYMRAIQVFQQVNKGQWPRNIDDIENFQMRHFLRHKYLDPVTGKAEWRLIHVQGNVLTDSLLTQNPDRQHRRHREFPNAPFPPAQVPRSRDGEGRVALDSCPGQRAHRFVVDPESRSATSTTSRISKCAISSGTSTSIP